MGLPSGLLWSTCNVGADKPTDTGLYFSWGNVEGHIIGEGYDFSQATYDATPAAEISGNLSLNEDAARENLGSPWRMPTSAEFQELYDNCTVVWTTMNGVSGYQFTSNVNGNTLFFPATGRYNGTTLGLRERYGFYWSSTIFSATAARIMYFGNQYVTPQDHDDRRYGIPVRAVCPSL